MTVLGKHDCLEINEAVLENNCIGIEYLMDIISNCLVISVNRENQ